MKMRFSPRCRACARYVCCSVLQCFAVYIYIYIYMDFHSSRSKTLRVAGHASGMHVAVCCSVLQCTYIYVCMLQCVAVCCSVCTRMHKFPLILIKFSPCCRACQVCTLQCVAVCCSVYTCIYIDSPSSKMNSLHCRACGR